MHIIPNGLVHKVSINDPRTGPCGTPDNKKGVMKEHHKLRLVNKLITFLGRSNMTLKGAHHD
jgi:hypothetical protein